MFRQEDADLEGPAISAKHRMVAASVLLTLQLCHGGFEETDDLNLDMCTLVVTRVISAPTLRWSCLSLLACAA